MSEQTYYQKRIPDLIKRLKNQVKKNLLVISLEVESELGEEKYLNVLKGRRMAAEDCIITMVQIEQLEKEQKVKSENGYFKDLLPELIMSMQAMVDLNLEVVDIDIDGTEGLTEDKYHAVLKARKTAGIDTEWVLKKIDELENLLIGKNQKKEKRKSWSVVAAEKE